MSPSGADLSCYACSTANEPGIPPAINCSHPIKQQCGEDPLTTDKQDRCVTITMSSRDGLGNSLYQEMRHCASEYYCSHGFCVHANVSGSLTSCNAKCCYGNICNNDGMTTASTPTLKSTKQREVLARQGADFSTVGAITKRKSSKSARWEMAKTVLFPFAFLSIVFFT
ncbi:hypothetical protein AC249_AIPGENE13103 [Exaiptasia diaphana]|nr:hypothetical protein AC249_AIPGENE13103 [Exaiptasia diaphana]